MTDMAFEFISVSSQDDVPVIAITDSHLRAADKCYGLRDEVLAAARALPSQDVLIDLEQVEFMGSIAFLVFIGIRRELSEGRIILCGLQPQVREAFLTCRLISVDPARPGPLEVADTLEAGAKLVAG